MPKKVRMYGPNSLERAQLYVDQHPDRDLVILKDSRTRRIAVCSPKMAEELRTQGFRPVETEN